MKNSDLLTDKFIDFLIKEKLTTTFNTNYNFAYNNFNFHLKKTFKNISFKNKVVLDIGGGLGIYSFYASLMGAREVICIDPFEDGSDNLAQKYFIKIKKKFKFNNVVSKNISLQNYQTLKKFDIIILKDSINHIDEKSCIHLLSSDINQKKYISLFDKIYNLMSANSTIFVSDCSPLNFFALLKISNPFVSEIEWFKHQKPNTWIKLMKKSNFKCFKVYWNSLNSLRFFGKLFENKYTSYFINSHFTIIAKKNDI